MNCRGPHIIRSESVCALFAGFGYVYNGSAVHKNRSCFSRDWLAPWCDLLAQRELQGTFPHPYLVSAHVHAVGVGFVMFLILGVALWLFPKPAKDDTRYQPTRIAVAYWILVIATSGRFLSESLRAFVDTPSLRIVILPAG